MSPAPARRPAFLDLAPDGESFRDAVLHGLRQKRKSIPCKFLYDEQGSALFEAICDLPEYYPTRTEMALLERHSDEIAALMGPSVELVEFGSGASRKVRILLDALERPAAYVPVDISREHLLDAATALASDYPGLEVVAVCADYTRRFSLPPSRGLRRIGFFPGSTIGNFAPHEALRFLRGAAELLSGGGLLIGVDLKKDKALLEAAYDDAAGITAAFNLNLLARINRELDGDCDLGRFRHHARYNPAAGRIEIHIESLSDQVLHVDGLPIRLAAGELIHTEYSHKFSVLEFQALAARAGFRCAKCWTDPAGLFSIHYLEAP